MIDSIQEICLECGFNSSSYFIKVFKKKVGMTPREYRIKLADSSCFECESDENA
ncbi:helix-turn-helix transcriptional regulator [Paenibacillus motobuensis]|uniref:helix-turn-helix transcriptional regulator n=1 Tax=Paenibacillus TaxID=44249 RepID=UPI00203EE989|nr:MULTISPECIES: helix-turn-helix transcriptional regulator [Paenibacillus]MCM3039569.1 helix-turn-helix transcriptional regulator [Paenibacillus lutimineralis]MCM3646673.1 helix-turn-helix transcriptional regulator [Paenibacillus motobuensis]